MRRDHEASAQFVHWARESEGLEGRQEGFPSDKGKAPEVGSAFLHGCRPASGKKARHAAGYGFRRSAHRAPAHADATEQPHMPLGCRRGPGGAGAAFFLRGGDAGRRSLLRVSPSHGLSEEQLVRGFQKGMHEGSRMTKRFETELLPRKWSDAKNVGSPHYFTGAPCKRGHICVRWASNGTCMECLRSIRLENIDSERAKVRNWRSKNIEKARLACRNWKSANVDRVKELNRQWISANPEKNREKVHRRRAIIAGQGGSIPSSDMALHRRNYGNKCAMCGAKASRKFVLEIDHIRPLSRGGQHVLSNIQFLCKSCNASKRARDPIEFAQSRGLLL